MFKVTKLYILKNKNELTPKYLEFSQKIGILTNRKNSVECISLTEHKIVNKKCNETVNKTCVKFY